MTTTPLASTQEAHKADSKAGSQSDSTRTLQPRAGISFWHGVRVIQARSSRFALVGAPFYVALFLGLLASSVVLHNSIRTTERALLLVASQPLFTPLLASGLIVALYLAISAATSLARERERGTLDVLLYGPVNEASVLLGIFLAHLRLYLVALAIILVWLAATALTLHLALSAALPALAFATLFAAAALIALALLTACLGKRTRISIVAFLLISGILLAIQLSDQVVALIAASGNGSESLLVINTVLGLLARVTGWLSPFALLAASADYLTGQQWSAYAGSLAILLVLSVLLLAAATWLIRRNRKEG